jgi:hypothetical protein
LTWTINSKLKRRLSARHLAQLVLFATLATGALAGAASAQERWQPRNHHHNWNGGYYNAPPVVYGSPYGSTYYGSPYYAPPVVYGPGLLNIQIR